MECTPNGAISFISQLYVGSISDVELTHVSGVTENLKRKQNIYVMANRGFNVHNQLKSINIDLNIPPFIDGRAQLPAAFYFCSVIVYGVLYVRMRVRNY